MEAMAANLEVTVKDLETQLADARNQIKLLERLDDLDAKLRIESDRIDAFCQTAMAYIGCQGMGINVTNGDRTKSRLLTNFPPIENPELLEKIKEVVISGKYGRWCADNPEPTQLVYNDVYLRELMRIGVILGDPGDPKSVDAFRARAMPVYMSEVGDDRQMLERYPTFESWLQRVQPKLRVKSDVPLELEADIGILQKNGFQLFGQAECDRFYGIGHTEMFPQDRLQFVQRIFDRKITPNLVSQMRLHKVNELASQLMGKDIFEEYKKDPKAFSVGRREDITALFADLQGFTSYSETAGPEEVVAKLVEYYERVVPIVRDEYQCAQIKFMADGILAWFKRSDPNTPDHGIRAIRAAVGMQKQMEILNKNWSDRDGKTFPLKIGINSGYAAIGNIAGNLFPEITCIGDVVNTASRLEGVARGGAIIASKATVDAITSYIDERDRAGIMSTLLQNRIELVPREPVNVKGKSQPVEIYEIKVK